MKRSASKKKEQSTVDSGAVGESLSKKKKKGPGAASDASTESSNKHEESSKKPSEILAEHLGMKLEFTVQPEDRPGLTYKKFVGLVHKQIKSRNPGHPNPKINAVIGAAWKDYKVELLENKDKDLSFVDTPKSSPKTNESTTDSSVMDTEVEVIDIADDKEQGKDGPSIETKKEVTGQKKKRMLGPIRIKLGKTSSKFQKSVEVSDGSNDDMASENEEEIPTKKLKNRAFRDIGDETDKSSDTGSTSSRSKKRKKKNGRKKIAIEIDSGDGKVEEDKLPKRKKAKLNERNKKKKGKKKGIPTVPLNCFIDLSKHN